MQSLQNTPSSEIARFFKENPEPSTWNFLVSKFVNSAVSDDVIFDRFRDADSSLFFKKIYLKYLTKNQSEQGKRFNFVELAQEASFKLQNNGLGGEYMHEPFQVACAALAYAALSVGESATFFTLPTSAGKSYIMALTINMIAIENNAIVLLTPTNLIAQTKKLIEPLCANHSLQIMSFEDFYTNKPIYDYLIIDECDQLIEEMFLYAPTVNKLTGVFTLCDSQEGFNEKIIIPSVLGFSATGDSSLELFARAVINENAQLVKLPSEYEYKTNFSNLNPSFEGVEDTYTAAYLLTDELASK